MTEQRIFIHGKHQAIISCRQCGKSKSIPVSAVLHLNKPIPAKCKCGHTFCVFFEKRSQYRKPTCLRGNYVKPPPAECSGDMIVEDLSRTGMLFRALGTQNIREGDLIKLRFTLDDGRESVIQVNAVTRRILEGHVGAEFQGLDEHTNKLLGFYLMA